MRRFVILLILALSAFGCMRTRHIEVCETCQCDGPSSSHSEMYSERRWLGIWPGQPAKIQP